MEIAYRLLKYNGGWSARGSIFGLWFVERFVDGFVDSSSLGSQMPSNVLCSHLLEAAGAGHRDAVAEIFDAKCDVNAVDAEGWSPLILASKVWLFSVSPETRQITQQDSGNRVQGSGFTV